MCLILLVSLLAVNIAASSYGILFRKKYIEVRGEIASLIKEYIDSRPKGIVLFFPAPYESLYNGFNIMEFVSYFNYKGFPLLIKGYEREGQCIITKAPEKLPDNLCFPRGCGLPFQCFSASQRGGDLIVFLTPIPVTDEYQKHSNLLFHHQSQLWGVEGILYLLARVMKIDKEWR